jgi:hypothetical protein
MVFRAAASGVPTGTQRCTCSLNLSGLNEVHPPSRQLANVNNKMMRPNFSMMDVMVGYPWSVSSCAEPRFGGKVVTNPANHRYFITVTLK